MPSFNNADNLLVDQFERAPGRTIWVNRATGSDTAGLGDGSLGLPYRTLGRAAQDLRSGRNDTVVVVGNLTGEGRVRIDGVNNFRIIGLGTVWDAAGSAPLSTIYTPSTSAAALLDGNVRYTVTAHPFVVGDYVFQWRGIGQTGTRPNTVSRVNKVPNANQFDVEVPQRGATFPNTQEPATTLVHLAISNCTNVIIQGFTFEANPFTADEWGGLVFDACRNVYVAECTFGNATLGFISQTIIIGTLSAAGTNLLVERCRFAPTTLDLFAPLGAEAPSIMVRGTIEVRFVSCLFTSFHRNAANIDAGWAEGGGEGFIHFATNPGLGATFVGCTVINRFGQPLGATPPDYTSLVHLDDPGQNGGLDRVFWRGNFFQDAVTGEPVAIDDAGGLEDEEPATIPNHDYVPTWGELIWRRRVQDAITVPGSMGEAVALQVYEGALYVDVDNGVSGTTLGVNGTPDNPVDGAADLAALLASTGLRRVVVRSASLALALTEDFDSIEFAGTGGIASVDLGSANDYTGCRFENLTMIDPDLSGSSTNEYVGCVIQTAVALRGRFERCSFAGTNTFEGGVEHVLVDCFSGAGAAFAPTLQPTAPSADTRFILRGWSGEVTFAGMDQAGCELVADLDGGAVTLAATNVDGTARLAGVVSSFVDSSGQFFVVDSAGLVNRDLLVDEAETTVEIDQATDPWQEVVYEPDGTTERVRFDLFDQDNAAINNANPLSDVTYVRRRARV